MVTLDVITNDYRFTLSSSQKPSVDEPQFDLMTLRHPVGTARCRIGIVPCQRGELRTDAAALVTAIADSIFVEFIDLFFVSTNLVRSGVDDRSTLVVVRAAVEDRAPATVVVTETVKDFQHVKVCVLLGLSVYPHLFDGAIVFGLALVVVAGELLEEHGLAAPVTPEVPAEPPDNADDELDVVLEHDSP